MGTTFETLSQDTKGQELLKRRYGSGRGKEELIETLQSFETFPLIAILGFISALINGNIHGSNITIADEIKYVGADEQSISLVNQLRIIGYNQYFFNDYINYLLWLKYPNLVIEAESTPLTLEEYIANESENLTMSDSQSTTIGKIQAFQTQYKEAWELANTISASLKNEYMKSIGTRLKDKSINEINTLKSEHNALVLFISGDKAFENKRLLEITS